MARRPFVSFMIVHSMNDTAVTQREIEDVLETFRNFDVRDIDQMMKTFQRKQEPLLVYIAAIVEREELNEHEYDQLITSVLLAWEVLRRRFGKIRKLKMNELQAMDEQMRALDPDSNAVRIGLQPQLMNTIQDNLAGAEPEVREERKPLILMTLTFVIHALDQACREA